MNKTNIKCRVFSENGCYLCSEGVFKEQQILEKVEREFM